MNVDPYFDWLKIPPERRPPTYFDLLGLPESEDNGQVIAAAAALQAQRVKANQNPARAEQCSKLLKELALAKAVLTDPEKRAKYLANLKAKAAGAGNAAKPGANPEAWWKKELQGSAVNSGSVVAPSPNAGAQSAPKPAAIAPSMKEGLSGEFKMPLSAARPARASSAAPKILLAGGAAVALAAGVALAVFFFAKPKPPDSGSANSTRPEPITNTTPATPEPKEKEPPSTADPVEFLPKLEEQLAPAGKPIEPREFKRHTAIVQCLALAPNGRRFLSGGMDNSVLDWGIDEDSAYRRHMFKTGAAGVAYMPNGRLAVCCDESTILVMDLAANTIKHRLQYPRGNAQCLVAANDGQHILVAGTDGALHWWNVSQARPERDIDISDSITVTSVALSPDGQLVAASCNDGKVGVWNIATQARLWLGVAHPGGATALVFSPDGQRIASAGLDKRVAVWSAADGKLVRRLAGHDQLALAVAFLSSGKQVVSGGRDAKVRLWDIDTGIEIRAFPFPAAVHCLAADREDRFVLAGGFGGALHLIPLKDALSDPSLRESPPATKYKVPAGEERQAAEATLRSTYKGQWESTKPEEVAVLLDRLQARTLGKETPATRYALFHLIRDAALRIGNLSVALKSAEELAQWFDVYLLEEKTATLAAAAEAAPPAVQKEVIESTQALLQTADKERKPELGKQLLQIMATSAKHSGSPELVKKVDAFQKQHAAQMAARDRAAELLAILKSKPDDPDANLAYGLLLHSQGNVREALSRVMKGSDKKLAALAESDLKEPSDLKPARELADGWWEASKTATEAKQLCLSRAKHWYDHIRPMLSGEEKLELGIRIVEIDKQLTPGVASSSGTTTPQPKVDPPKPGLLVRTGFNTLRTEAVAKTQWKFEADYRIEALGLRFPQGKGAMTSQFQLVDNWKVVILLIPEYHVEIEVNQEAFGFDQYYFNTPIEIVVEKKGKKLAYTAVQRTRALGANIIQLKDEKLAPSTISIRSSGIPGSSMKRDGMLLQSIIVNGTVKMLDEKDSEKPKEK
jgi:hypothetical protein